MQPKLCNGASKQPQRKPHLQQQQLLLASLGLNLGLLLFFFVDFKPSSSTSTTIEQSIPQSPPSIQSCALPKTHISIADSSASTSAPVNLDHGDPTMFEAFWLGNKDACTLVLLGWEHMSYFASRKHFIWFVEQELENQIRSLHSLVGNAATQGSSIVVGTGSTQLFQAALYALTYKDPSPARVVSATPYYSSYPVLTDYLKSGLYHWAGDASTFKPEENSSYIELVTSPNNPDGTIREAVVKGDGPVIYDLAYYWPHYTPITAELHHDIMLFTVSKSTGHAGSRIGWAVVKDPEVAKIMTKFIELSTIGVSHDSQLRAAQILKSIVRGYSGVPRPFKLGPDEDQSRRLFHFGYQEMRSRWESLRRVVSRSQRFNLSEFVPAFCSFFGQLRTPHPAFAWLKCTGEPDCKRVLEAGGILSRSGVQFGVGAEFVRISMLDRTHNFETFLTRLEALVGVRVVSFQ